MNAPFGGSLLNKSTERTVNSNKSTSSIARIAPVLTVGFGAGALLASVFWNFVHGQKTEASPPDLRKGVVVGPGANADRDGDGDGKRARSLNDLRDAFAKRPSRQNTVELWTRTDGMQLEKLRELFMAAASSGDGDDWQNEEIMEVLLERILQLDPQAAADLFSEMDPEQVTALLPKLALIDPAAAVEIYKTISAFERGALPVRPLLRALAVTDLKMAKEVVGMMEPRNRAGAYGVIVGSLSAEDAGGALAFLQSLGDTELAGGLGDLAALGRVAAHDPAAVAQLLERLPMSSAAASKFARLAEEWVAREPEEALAWANGLEFDAVRDKALRSLYQSWAKKDRGQAFEALAGVEDVGFRDDLFRAMTREVIGSTFRQDPSGAEKWVRGLEGEFQSYALGILGAQVAQRDLDLATRYLDEALAGDGDPPLAGPGDRIGYAYGLVDPAAASEWAMGLPERRSLQQLAIEGVARAWTASDPVAASEWIATLPAGAARAGAIYMLVNGIRDSDPASAFRWASSIESDAEKRLYLLKGATYSWKRIAPEETRAAIENLTIPTSEKNQLFRRLGW